MTTLRDIQHGAEAALQSAIDHLSDLKEENDIHAFTTDEDLDIMLEDVERTLNTLTSLTIPDES